MNDTLDLVAADKEVDDEGVDQQQVAEQLLAQARQQGVDLVGPDGLLNQLTKRVLETALQEEMADHLGYDKHDPVGRNRGKLPQRGAVEDGADRDRAGRDRRSPRHRRQLPAADREEAAAASPGSTRSCCR